MATLVTVSGQTYKRRSPWGVWGLGLITAGIYIFVWYYKINDEARRHLQDGTIKPALSVLAFIPGVMLFYIPPIVSVYRSGERIKRMQQQAGVQATISSVLGVLAFFVLMLWVPYFQSNLNKVWDANGTTA